MSTVGKALGLLNLLSSLEEDVGLTDLARLAGLDKATTRRLLVELEAFGFVEQDEASRRYRLGPAPVRLARLREARFPFVRSAVPFVKALADRTGETCHLAEFANGELRSLHVEAPPRANRINVEIGVPLPLHATASGLALLSRLDAARIAAYLRSPLEAFTGETVTDPYALRQRLAETRARGWSISRNGLESGVISTAAAIVAPDGQPVGTLAIAAPASRVEQTTLTRFGEQVAEAARALGERLFGKEGAPGADDQRQGE